MDRGAWRATVQGVAKSRTRLSDSTTRLLRLLVASLFQAFGPAGPGPLFSVSPNTGLEARLTQNQTFAVSYGCVTPGRITQCV